MSSHKFGSLCVLQINETQWNYTSLPLGQHDRKSSENDDSVTECVGMGRGTQSICLFVSLLEKKNGISGYIKT